MTYATLVIQFHIKKKNGKQKLQQVVVLIVVLHNVKLHSTNLKMLNQIPEFYFIFFQRISRYFKKEELIILMLTINYSQAATEGVL